MDSGDVRGLDAPPAPSRLRWIAVALCMLYGFAKLTGSQFTVLDSELEKPLGRVSGFWLTWYYFGYSPVYKTFVALAEIGGSLLLAIPRTALLGALFLLPVMVNVVAIDVCYGVDPGATLVALLICACLWLVIRPHASRLKEAVLLPGSSTSPLRFASLGLLLAAAFGVAYWAANVNNRLPTPIDGAWSVALPAGGSTAPSPTDVFFERNRAHLATFRLSDGREEAHHFEVDDAGSIHVWQTWLAKGTLLYAGRIRDDGVMELKSVGAATPSSMMLRRRPRR